jgi:hypothetical protein
VVLERAVLILVVLAWVTLAVLASVLLTSGALELALVPLAALALLAHPLPVAACIAVAYGEAGTRPLAIRTAATAIDAIWDGVLSVRSLRREHTTLTMATMGTTTTMGTTIPPEPWHLAAIMVAPAEAAGSSLIQRGVSDITVRVTSSMPDMPA